MAMLTDYQKMTGAQTTIENASKEFNQKGTAFIANLTTALSTFEGATKDALMTAKIGQSGSEVEGTLAYFVEKQIPDLLNGLAQLLKGNIDTVVETDEKLAAAIEGKS